MHVGQGWLGRVHGDLGHRPVVVLLQPPGHEPQVDLGRVERPMAQELLDIPHVCASPQQVDGDAVPEEVRAQVPGIWPAPPVQVIEEPVDAGLG